MLITLVINLIIIFKKILVDNFLQILKNLSLFLCNGTTFAFFSLHKKWSFPLRISSVNVTKSAVSWTKSAAFVCWSCHVAGFIWVKDFLAILPLLGSRKVFWLFSLRVAGISLALSLRAHCLAKGFSIV